VARDQLPGGELAQAKPQPLRRHERQYQQRRGEGRHRQGSEAMVAQAKVPPAPLGKGDAGNKQGRSSQGVDPVDVVPRLHAAETQAAGGTDAARARSENDEIGADEAAAGRQGGVDIHRLVIAAEGMAATDRGAEQSLFLQPGHGAAEGKGQGRGVGHDIGNAAGGPVILKHRRGGGHHAVQLTDEHRRSAEAGKAGQPRPVARRLLLAAEHAHLPGRIAELHDVAAALEGGQGTAEVEFHEVITAAAQLQVDGRCVQQEPVAPPHRAGEEVVV